jgi:protein TonB
MPRPRRRPWALPISLALHALAVVLLVSGIRRDWARTPAVGPIVIALPAVGGGGGGGGANREAYITPPAAQAPPRERPPEPPLHRPVDEPPVVVPPLSEPTPTESPDTQPSVAAAPVDSAAVRGSTGGGAGPGTGPGTGGGTGGGAGTGVGPGAGPGPSGAGGRGRPPEPRQLVIPPSDFPKELRGRRIEVTFFVAADGRVEHIQVVPAIAHGGFARKFDESMRNYRFRPARSAAGAPISGSTTITVSF